MLKMKQLVQFTHVKGINANKLTGPRNFAQTFKLDLQNIDDDTDATGDEHDFGVNFKLFVDAPEDGHVEEDPGHQPYHQDGDGCAQNFGPVPSETHSLGGRP